MSLKHWVARIAMPYGLWLARSITPSAPVVVVHGFPDVEGNAVETVRALATSYSGTIYWLDSPGAAYATAVGIAGSRVRHVRRLSLRGLAAYIFAEATFFTHGIYGVPPRVPRKPTVNVWHGEAIKNFFPLLPDRRAKGGVADIHIGSTHRLAPEAVKASGHPHPRLLLTGYPRTDQLRRPCSDEQLSILGIDPQRPFVVWVPTFRQTSVVSATPTWSDTAEPERDAALADIMSEYSRQLAAADIQLVVKPHPLDRLSRAGEGLISVNDAMLRGAGAPLYSLLGRSAGLISDFSSVTNEYLALDRPIAYFFPDSEAYAARRGIFPPDALDHLAGITLRTAADVARFGADVNRYGADSGAIRSASRDWFGPISEPDAAVRMLHGVAECARPGLAKRLSVRSAHTTLDTQSAR